LDEALKIVQAEAKKDDEKGFYGISRSSVLRVLQVSVNNSGINPLQAEGVYGRKGNIVPIDPDEDPEDRLICTIAWLT
jgi:hypothetical protein